jgi:hypothetical protein
VNAVPTTLNPRISPNLCTARSETTEEDAMVKITPTWGVRCLRWMLPMIFGSEPDRPIA